MMMTHRLPDLIWTDIMHSDFPEDFKTYVKEKDLLFQSSKRNICGQSWVFWSRENHRWDRPPPCSEIFDLGSETRIAATNPELITHSLKTVIENIVGRWSQVLVQFWIAIKIGEGRTLLTTRDQPFGISHGVVGYDGLCRYRLIFKDYEIYVDDDDDGESDEDYLGLPGRVFRHQQLESTPDVYSFKEYSVRDRVVNINNFKGCLAVPVFEPSRQCCVGVLEVVATFPQSTDFIHVVAGDIRKSFEAVGLRSLKVYVSLEYFQKGDLKVQKAWAEIKKVLERVCTTHKLPFAQTWGSCSCRNCNLAVIDDSFNVSCRERLFYYRNASYHRDLRKLRSFSCACIMHPLGKGEGVVGTAFSSHNSAFCRDITQFSITKYPLAHHARENGLTGCFAICLRSSYTGNDVYVLEFFLPPSKTEVGDPRSTLVPLLTTMKQHFQGFTVASGKELGEELPIEVIDFSKDGELVSFQISLTARSHTLENGGEMEWLDLCDQQLAGVDAINTGNNVDSNTQKNNNVVVTSSSVQKCITNSSKRQHRKAGIPISHEDIQQCSGMKLNNAAECLGVSRSTFKRACREYGISWWSPRKRNKNNNSLSNKFVQGAAQEQIREPTQPPISDPPYKHDFAIATHTEPQFMAVQDTSTVTIKARYGDVFIKFQLSVSSGMVEFQQQVAKRLKNLQDGTYRVMYQDEDDDWILIACDEDLQKYICHSWSLGRNTITMSIQPITNCPP